MSDRRFDLVLFDLDGTLVDTAPEITDAVNDTLRHFGWTGVDEAQVTLWIGHGTEALLLQSLVRASGSDAETLRASGRLDEVMAVFGQHYRERCGTRSRLYPGVRATLRALNRAGTRLVIVTNKEQRYTDRVLAAHDLHAAFDRLVCGDTLPTRKPDPAGVHACLAAFDVAPPRALFVGDSSIDAATARAAGVPVWLVPYGYNMGESIERCAPDRVIADFSALLEPLARPGATA